MDKQAQINKAKSDVAYWTRQMANTKGHARNKHTAQWAIALVIAQEKLEKLEKEA